MAPAGIAEVGIGSGLDRLCVALGDALDAVTWPGGGAGLADGDVVVVASKVVSKAEGRIAPASERERAIAEETVRVVAARAGRGGVTRIVQNRQGIVMAAAGVDASNTPEGSVLLLPVDPDRSARELRARLAARFGRRLAVLVTDTVGRPWRFGVGDFAIGAAGLTPLADLRGTPDANGRPLDVTEVAVADEIAAAADLVKGKATARPVAVVRGVAHLVTEADGPGAAGLNRTGAEDMFSLGTAEAFEAGRRSGLGEDAGRLTP